MYKTVTYSEETLNWFNLIGVFIILRNNKQTIGMWTEIDDFNNSS
jgi:hypothetical protein